MTADQEIAVNIFRQQGFDNQWIANLLGLEADDIELFCRRDASDDNSDVSAEETEVTDPDIWADHCKNCGVVITQTPHARERYFCSPACRQSWWNAHLDLVKRKAFYSFTCITCGKEFEAYGNKHRKYCCHECYLVDRFGKKKQK